MMVCIQGAIPRDIPGTARGQEWSRRQYLVCQSSHNVPRNVQGAEVVTKNRKTWSLVSRSTNRTKQTGQLQDSVYYGKRMAWSLNSGSGLLPPLRLSEKILGRGTFVGWATFQCRGRGVGLSCWGWAATSWDPWFSVGIGLGSGRRDGDKRGEFPAPGSEGGNIDCTSKTVSSNRNLSSLVQFGHQTLSCNTQVGSTWSRHCI